MGIVQGLTEFLPVSSSGHLVLTENIFGSGETDLLFDTVVHLGTLAAVLIVLRRDILDMISHFFEALIKARGLKDLTDSFSNDAPFRLAILVIIGTIPAVIIGFTLEETFEMLFSSPLAVGIALCITGGILLLTKLAPDPAKNAKATTIVDTLLIGLAQAAAITPGISRSGATISAAMFLKTDRDLAGRFSFLLSIPAILGAAVFQALKIESTEIIRTTYFLYLLIGFAAAAVVGAFALVLLIGLVKKGKFFYFGFYCLPVGLIAIIGSLLGMI